MMDQLIIGEKASFDDFGASIATRHIGTPTKKSIRETVPFSNVTYDFSKIDGELYWNERELEYVFEMTASTPEELEEMKTAFSNWVMNVFEEKIHDPFIPDYHFVGTFDDMDFEDEESLDKTTVTVKFLAYPFKIRNVEKAYRVVVPADYVNVELHNDGARTAIPTIITPINGLMIDFGNLSEVISAGTWIWEDLKIPAGGTVEIVLEWSGVEQQLQDEESRTVELRFAEEVL